MRGEEKEHLGTNLKERRAHKIEGLRRKP